MSNYIKYLNLSGIEYIDLVTPFSTTKSNLYWDTDHHINIAAHQIIAEEVLESF